MFSDGWHQIVTKAEIAEFSFVTIPSNRSAVLRNSLAEEYAERKGLDKNEVLKNIKEMKLNETTEVVETGDPVSEVVAEPEVVPAIEGNAVEVETNEVATLSAKIAEMETNFASKLSEVESNHAKVIADMETNFATRLEQATEAIRSEERNSLAKVVTEGAHSNVKTAEQFRAKYA
jgi:hypothetical protein